MASLNQVEVHDGEATPNPTALTSAQAVGLRLNVEKVEEVKRTGCAFYNACLNTAAEGKWPGFSCQSCEAYVEPDAHQQMMNHVRLRVLDRAAEILDEHGGPCRIRGVKPGADAKRTIKPVEETAPWIEAFTEV